MQTISLPITLLLPNTGQIEGLPQNPRFIRDEKFKRLVKSIADDPEMLELRPCVVFPFGDYYIIIMGNMRYRGCLELKHTHVFCKVLPADTPVEKLRAYVIKDNVAFGSDDMDLLANEWDATELTDWGMDVPGWDAPVDQYPETEISDKLPTEHKCPKCGYEFN